MFYIFIWLFWGAASFLVEILSYFITNLPEDKELRLPIFKEYLKSYRSYFIIGAIMGPITWSLVLTETLYKDKWAKACSMMSIELKTATLYVTGLEAKQQSLNGELEWTQN